MLLTCGQPGNSFLHPFSPFSPPPPSHHPLTLLSPFSLPFPPPSLLLSCIFVELLIGKAVFPGRDEVRQLDQIFRICGSPNSKDWPEHEDLPWSSIVPPNRHKRKLREHFIERFFFSFFFSCSEEYFLILIFFFLPFRHVDEYAIDLLDKLLVLNPKNRLSAEQALNHMYFKSHPLPFSPDQFRFFFFFFFSMVLFVLVVG